MAINPMKKKTTEQKKIFAKHTYNKGLISRLCISKYKNSVVKKNIQLKNKKRSKQLIEEIKWQADIGKCSVCLDIRVMVKTTTRYI